MSRTLDRYCYQCSSGLSARVRDVSGHAGNGVLHAVINEYRRRVLAVLSVKGACSYTELMRESRV